MPTNRSPLFIDLVGQRFGSLLVLNREQEPRYPVRFWCRCNCGVELFVPGYNMRTGERDCCSKARHRKRPYRDLSGMRFGRLLVIRPREERFGNQAYEWWCRCDCGTEKYIRLSGLAGNVVSCGCYSAELSKRPKTYLQKRPYEWLYNVFLSSARVHGDTDITYESFLEYTKIPNCHYCEAPISWPTPFRGREHTSDKYFLDRINPFLGYLQDNVVVCCSECNYGKSKRYSYGEWRVMTEALRRYRKERGIVVKNYHLLKGRKDYQHFTVETTTGR